MVGVSDCDMLLRARLARLGGPCLRCLSSVPRIGQLRTVREVVDAHRQHGQHYKPIDLGSSWNTVGKLVRHRSEQQALQSAPAMLDQLVGHTENALPLFRDRPLANTVNALAGLHD